MFLIVIELCLTARFPFWAVFILADFYISIWPFERNSIANKHLKCRTQR